MKTRSGYKTDRLGWAALLPPRDARPPLVGTHHAAWGVVGAGVTGLACARRLAELHPGQQVYVLEAREIAQGASGRSSGFAVDNSRFGGAFNAAQAGDYKRVNRINRAGLEALRSRVATLKISCQWQENGFVHGAADRRAKAEYGHYLGYLQALEIAHTPLDSAALAARLGTGHYQNGVHVHAGALVQPAALVRGLAEALPANVQLFERSPVVEITNRTLHLPNGILHADKIILATNYEAGRLGFLQRYLTGITLSGSFTRVLTGAERESLGTLKQWGVLSLHNAGATVRLTADHRICLRNTAEYHGGALLSAAQLARRQRTHRAAFDARFPHLRQVPFEHAWSGVEGISRNNTNFFGQQSKGVFFAGGYNGSGISRGTAFGVAMAEYASGGQSALISDCLASAPASWTPPRPFLDIGAALSAKVQYLGLGKDG